MKTKQELRNKLLGQFDKAIVEKLTPHLSAVIDENIEALIEGSILVNDKIPETEDEIICALNYGLVSRLQVYQGVIDAAKKLSNDDTTVTINYRGTTVKV